MSLSKFCLDGDFVSITKNVAASAWHKYEGCQPQIERRCAGGHTVGICSYKTSKRTCSLAQSVVLRRGSVESTFSRYVHLCFVFGCLLSLLHSDSNLNAIMDRAICNKFPCKLSPRTFTVGYTFNDWAVPTLKQMSSFLKILK
jgi:hypothetical protein